MATQAADTTNPDLAARYVYTERYLSLTTSLQLGRLVAAGCPGSNPEKGTPAVSRITIPAIDPQHSCVVGYDPPLGTFFAQVFRVKNGQPQPGVVHWVGTDLHEIPTIPDLAQAIQDYAVIPDDIRQQLEADRHAVGFRPNFGTWLLERLHRTRKDSP